ncbi:mitochondrial carrier domain-containing protein, partial [Pseudomassariella vexata]
SQLLPALHHALSGSAGTAISTCLTYPLSLVITRLQVQRQLVREGKLQPPQGTGPQGPPGEAAEEEGAYRGIVDAFSRICADSDAGGWKALFGGLAGDVGKSVLDSFLFFLFYEWFRARRLRSRSLGKGLRVWEELAIGMAAGACSRAFTTPIANVVTRKQTAALLEGGAEAKELTLREIMQAIREEKGLAGFWSGYSATLVLSLNPGITFFLQEMLKKSLLGAEKWDKPGPHLTFLFAALSKSAASAITYPFQLAKARLQLVEVIEAKLAASRAANKLAKQSIIGVMRQIVDTEGVGSLYDGLSGELLRGFFGHGMTMLAKDVVYKLLFKIYLVVAAVLSEMRRRR